MDDADIDTPLPQLNAKKEAAFEVDEEGIAMLMSMGFSRVQYADHADGSFFDVLKMHL